MKFSTPDGMETEQSEESVSASSADLTEATVDLPDRGTVTVAEALAAHEEHAANERVDAILDFVMDLRDQVQEQQETIEHQQEVIQEHRDMFDQLVSALAKRNGRGFEDEPIEWPTEL